MWPFSKRSESPSNAMPAQAVLEQEVLSLRASLAASRASLQRSRRKLFLATGMAIAAWVFALSTGGESMQQSVASVLQESGIVEPTSGLDVAYQAYEEGHGATSLRLARPFAEQGDARAQALMGLNYYNGRGIPKNEEEAAKWFRLAADQGEAGAAFHLGLMYVKGRGVPQSFSDAAKWIHLSAEAGNGEAQFNLGVLYQQGKGVPQNNVHAHKWFNLAAARFAGFNKKKRAEAIKARALMAAKMTAEEIKTAQELARDWQPQQSISSAAGTPSPVTHTARIS